MEKNCEFCGEKFEAKRSRHIYCSKKCGNNAYKERERIKKGIPKNKCETCGDLFIPYRSTNRFCSKRCRIEDQASRFKNECIICGNIFKSARKDVQFCSKKCASIPRIKNKIKKKCLNCLSEYTAYKKDQKFCCASCADSYKKGRNRNTPKIENRKCEYCNKEYRPSSNRDNKKFCSRICWENFVNEESTVKLTCEYCNKGYVASVYGNGHLRKFKGRKFCSKECADLDRIGRYVREDSGNWLGGETELNCFNCNKVIYKDTYMANAFNEHFCSRECKHDYHRNTINCLNCNKELTIPKSAFERSEKTFCDMKCCSEYNRSVSKNKLKGYIRNWSESNNLRKDCFERDNYKSVMSGDGGYLEHHHIIPINVLINEYNINEENVTDFEHIFFDLNNVITLLKEEHRQFHRVYGYQCTKENFEEFVRNYKEKI